MKKKCVLWLFILLAASILSACQNNADTKEKNHSAKISMDDISTNNNAETGELQMQGITVEVGGQKFQATVYDNTTAQAFVERLPLTINMEELHGNEKYFYFDEGLPTNAEYINRIQTGDIMLFGSDCLVLFFEDFYNSYRYTKIGNIEDREAFAHALGDGTVNMSFEIRK